MRAPAQSASIVGVDEVVGDRDLEPDLVGEADLDRGPAIGLDPVELAAVALDPADRDAAHLGAIERLEHVVGLLRPDDADHQLHGSSLDFPDRRAREPNLVPAGVNADGDEFPRVARSLGLRTEEAGNRRAE